jgi:hypothetical protein
MARKYDPIAQIQIAEDAQTLLASGNLKALAGATLTIVPTYNRVLPATLATAIQYAKIPAGTEMADLLAVYLGKADTLQAIATLKAIDGNDLFHICQDHADEPLFKAIADALGLIQQGFDVRIETPKVFTVTSNLIPQPSTAEKE